MTPNQVDVLCIQGTRHEETRAHTESVVGWAARGQVRSPDGTVIGDLEVSVGIGSDTEVAWGFPAGVTAAVVQGTPCLYDVKIIPPGGEPLGFVFGKLSVVNAQTSV